MGEKRSFKKAAQLVVLHAVPRQGLPSPSRRKHNGRYAGRRVAQIPVLARPERCWHLVQTATLLWQLPRRAGRDEHDGIWGHGKPRDQTSSSFPAGCVFQELSTARSCPAQAGEWLSSIPICTTTRTPRRLVRKILEGSSSGWKKR